MTTTTEDTSPSKGAPGPERSYQPRAFLSKRARIVMGVLLIGGIAGFIYAFAGLSPSSEPVVTDAAVRSVYPAPGDRGLRQDTIHIELVPEFTGRLETVAGLDVRQDVLYIDGLNRYSYIPTEDSVTGILKPGRQCASAFIWPVGEPESTGRRFSWCFNVH